MTEVLTVKDIRKTPIRIDPELAITTLRECVAERGEDFEYKNPYGNNLGVVCFYWHETDGSDEPGCLIGLMLYKLGVSKDYLKEREGVACNQFGMRVDSDATPARLQDSEFEWVSPADEICRSAQFQQDAGKTWGVALAAAEAAYDEYRYENRNAKKE